ncbi:MAG TPA: Rieske 2Fe-2S domain-containing protein [Myxococcota bacterium]|nr:Rieske 2Fe-2S domain-containing protein [Myxococcota bacterium]
MAHAAADSAPASTEPPRRSFIGLAVGLLGAAVTLLVGAPAVGFLIHPLRKDPVSRGAAGALSLGQLGRFNVGVPVRVNITAALRDAWSRFDGVRLGAAWVVRTGESTVKVFSATCPHLGCAVDLDPVTSHFACPCHTSNFSLDGARLSGPAPRGMDELHAEVKGGELWVEFRRYRTGLAARVEA